MSSSAGRQARRQRAAWPPHSHRDHEPTSHAFCWLSSTRGRFVEFKCRMKHYSFFSFNGCRARAGRCSASIEPASSQGSGSGASSEPVSAQGGGSGATSDSASTAASTR
ncbi:hypothetical protein PVAP13_5NG426320 [Panicum virgatum]|uniref:Uncharacterized protein n=1 Tax=Panicum virgatum TaxID=38727 RepID=A0A8T0RWA9_PANVG|nr:hypothetical protein PVAP13_5NG426320 [Panicum virgatum]